MLNQPRRDREPTEAEKRKRSIAWWTQRGYDDATCGRKQRSRETLVDLGGEAAVTPYLNGYRTGSRQETG